MINERKQTIKRAILKSGHLMLAIGVTCGAFSISVWLGVIVLSIIVIAIGANINENE